MRRGQGFMNIQNLILCMVNRLSDDQRLSAVGSYNLDSRSAFLNTESMVVIDSERFAAQLIGAIDSKIKNSTLIADNKKI
ncbi:hypothetical protein RCO48_23580 [Peribacillus frigoritolerans]|nr:hypothetical protein [Peribacillus frigoritolerans]